MDEVLTKYLTFDLLVNDKNLFLYQTGEGGNGASVILEKTNQLSQGYQGYGAVQFLKSITFTYFRLRGFDLSSEGKILCLTKKE